MTRQRRRVGLPGGTILDLDEGGRSEGRVALVLHGEEGPGPLAGTVDHLGVEHRVLSPVGPRRDGSGRTDALARTYLDLLAERDATDVVVVGASCGGWVAARIVQDLQGKN